MLEVTGLEELPEPQCPVSPIVLGLTYWEEEATGDGWRVEVGSPVISGVKGLISVREVTVYETYHLGAGRL